MNLQTDSTKRWLLNNKRAQNIIEVSRLQTIDFISLLTWKFVTLITLFPFSLASSFLLNGGNSYVHIFSYFHKSIRSKISNVFYCDIFINEYRYLIQNLERFSKKKELRLQTNSYSWNICTINQINLYQSKEETCEQI